MFSRVCIRTYVHVYSRFGLSLADESPIVLLIFKSARIVVCFSALCYELLHSIHTPECIHTYIKTIGNHRSREESSIRISERAFCP